MIARGLVIALLLAISAPAGGAGLPVARVGIVLDGPLSRPVFSREQVRAEIAALLEGEWRLELGEETTRRGDWTLAGARRALEAQLADGRIDVVVTLGVLASQAAAEMESLPKPVVAAVVADPELQGFPLDDGTSGKPDFTYLTDFRSIEQQLQSFHRAVDFDDLAILVDAHLLTAMPRLRREKERAIEENFGVRVEVVPVGSSLEPAYARLAEADAVYITPLLRFSADDMRELADRLAGRGLPSFSMLGGDELEYGLLMNLGGGEQADIAAARRIALNVQRILLGDEPAEIPVALNHVRRLTINMAVAERIGYEPAFSVLADARLLNPRPGQWGEPLSFTEALAIAVRGNRRLQAAAYGPELAGTELDSARSRLLPRLGLEASRSQIDADRALLRPERSTDLEVSARQIVYSDDAVADWRAAGRRVDASILDYRARELDVMRSAGEAYLQVLRARAIYEVRQANLDITRENLQLAQVRESIGYSGRADVLRWESRLASDRVDLLDAERSLDQAGVRLGQALGSSQETPPRPAGDSVDSALGYFRSERFGRLIDSRATWDRFRAFLVREALERSPELAGLDERIAAGERQRLAARRKFYLPEVALQAGAGERIQASGAGSGSSLFQGLIQRDDRSWNVALTASWPIFSGGALRARLSAAELELARLHAERLAAEEDIEARMRLALHATGASFLSIGLTEEAARAARENLDIVSDAYGRGAASITDLLEAQDALLDAELGTENARYRYLIDLMGVLRAAADFRLVLEPAYRQEFLRRARAFVEDGDTDTRSVDERN
jgi:outer membrane protein TolC